MSASVAHYTDFVVHGNLLAPTAHRIVPDGADTIAPDLILNDLIADGVVEIVNLRLRHEHLHHPPEVALVLQEVVLVLQEVVLVPLVASSALAAQALFRHRRRCAAQVQPEYGQTPGIPST